MNKHRTLEIILNKLFVLQNVPAWNPNIRSKTAIKSTNKIRIKHIEEGASKLNKIESLIIKNNANLNDAKIKLPSLKIVIIRSQYGYVRNDNVLVIPIGCLGP